MDTLGTTAKILFGLLILCAVNGLVLYSLRKAVPGKGWSAWLSTIGLLLGLLGFVSWLSRSCLG